MNKKFVVASKNAHKIQEIKQILAEFPFDVIPMEQAGFTDDIEETGTSFEENSMIKAQAIFLKTGMLVMADDSGLEVDFLEGAPGIFSARFAGKDATDEDRIEKLLNLLKNVPLHKRTARFVCSVTVIIDENTNFTVKGFCEGLIAFEPIGDKGFGYDPIFYISDLDKTIAQLEPEVKNLISHRGRALQTMQTRLKEYLR